MKSIQTLDNLRDIKATADGSSVGFQTPQIQDGCLQELKQLTLMHIPSSVTEETRSKFKKLILETFKGNILHYYYIIYIKYKVLCKVSKIDTNAGAPSQVWKLLC